MNIKQLRKCVQKDVHLLPVPLSFTWTPWPQPIPPEYNLWRFETVDEKRRVIELANLQGYRKEIGFDHIHDFMTPGILKLNSQMIMHGRRVSLVPLWPAYKRQSIEGQVPCLTSSPRTITQTPATSGGAMFVLFALGVLVGAGLASGGR